MTIQDPQNNIIEQIRINTGDIEEPYILEDIIYQYILDVNDQDVYKATIQSLEAIVASYAKMLHEKVGDEEQWGQEAYRNYQDLLNEWKYNPSRVSKWLPFAGGISKSDMEKNRCNPDANRPGITEGFTTRYTSSIWRR